jgi:prophage antirepressor-like protein
MTKIAIYLFGYDEAQTIATRTIAGQHWYASRDICNMLGIENHSQAVHRKRETDELTLTAREWTTENIYNGRSKRRMLFVNDNGMLKLILQTTSVVAAEIQQRARKTPNHLIPASWQTELLEK